VSVYNFFAKSYYLLMKKYLHFDTYLPFILFFEILITFLLRYLLITIAKVYFL